MSEPFVKRNDEREIAPLKRGAKGIACADRAKLSSVDVAGSITNLQVEEEEPAAGEQEATSTEKEETSSNGSGASDEKPCGSSEDKPCDTSTEKTSEDDAEKSEEEVEQVVVTEEYEKVYGPGVTLGCSYLLDRSSNWSRVAFEHVLRPWNSGTKNQSFLNREERLDVIKQIGEVYLKSSLGADAGQPVVHVDDQLVYVRSLTQELLEKIWESPPVIRGQPMVFVFRGFPVDRIAMYRLEGLLATTQEELLAMIDGDPHKHQVYVVLSPAYRVMQLQGGPVCPGTLVIYASPTRPVEEFAFLGHKCCKIEPEGLPHRSWLSR